MRRIKGRTAAKLSEEFPNLKKRYRGRHFRGRGYFCAASGQITDDMIKNYPGHHFEPNPDSGMKVES